jgi:hypothetical protein
MRNEPVMLNKLGGAEDSQGETLVDALALIPMLHVDPAEFRSRQAKRFGAKRATGPSSTSRRCDSLADANRRPSAA